MYMEGKQKAYLNIGGDTFHAKSWYCAGIFIKS